MEQPIPPLFEHIERLEVNWEAKFWELASAVMCIRHSQGALDLAELMVKRAHYQPYVIKTEEK